MISGLSSKGDSDVVERYAVLDILEKNNLKWGKETWERR